jgi:SagB-type dehydrogenase family enzyme
VLPFLSEKSANLDIMKDSDRASVSQEIIRYHEETKHHYDRYARSSGHMDWDNQPNPFRFYEDTTSIGLPFLKKDPSALFTDLYRRDNNSSRGFDISNIAGFLELSLGLSAWKAAGNSQWSLRINPSSGNLHPTEAHLILPRIEALGGGIYHYNPLLHALEQRALLDDTVGDDLASHFGCPGFMIGFSSIFWRESWKYGERAFRYCNHDVGHALAAVSLSANLFGWRVSFLSQLSDRELDAMLGFDKTRFDPLEEEHPDLMCWVHPHPSPDIPRRLPEPILSAFRDAAFKGRPNRLSKQPVNWEIIYKTADLTRRPVTAAKCCEFADLYRFREEAIDRPAAKIIRQRRSATAFDRKGSVPAEQFLSILDKTLPRSDCAPFDAELGDPALHLLIFVHQVEGLTPGLYFFIRNNKALDPIKSLTRSKFAWDPVEENFPLFLLEKGSFRQQAIMVSCHQEIAGHSAFSLGMIADFKGPVTSNPYVYRQLFWESGMIGQVLYLAAEAHGLRGTGIGCFFDDAVHEILGLADNQYQSLYHFTIGKPVEDQRLTTYPPYHHLKRVS